MGIARVGAGADFDAVALEAGNMVEGLFEGEGGEDRGEDADFHNWGERMEITIRITITIKKQRPENEFPPLLILIVILIVISHSSGTGMNEDIEKILFREETIQSRVEELAGRIARDYRGRELTVVAVMNGALMFTADLLRRIPLPLKLDCISVASYHGGLETSGVVQFDQLSLPDIDGRHVLVVDDILDSGLTLDAIAAKFRQECRPLSIRACVLLKKKRPRLREAIEAEYVGFEIEDEFVVGYGLDYREQYRNLPFVGVLRANSIQPPQDPGKLLRNAVLEGPGA